MAFLLVTLVLLAVVPVVGWSASLTVSLPVAAAGVLLAGAALRRGSPPTKPTAVLAAALMVLFPTGLVWQPLMALALGLLALVAWRVPEARVKLARGSVPWLPTLAAAAVTPLGLVGWVAVLHPDLRDVTQRYVPDLPLALLLVGGLLFAIVNATLEELIWRGVFQDGLERVTRPGAAVAIQAISFGVMHAHGVPRGAVGVVLVGVWGVMLGLLRRHAKGLLAPVLAHFVADSVIATIILTVYR
jgi:uncharacterized protein